MAQIKLEQVSFDYGTAPLIRDLSLEVEAGSFLGIVGPNGVGKTTLLNLLCGGLSPIGGRVLLEGRPVRSYRTLELSRRIAVVRQQHVPVFGFTVGETVMMARTPFFGALGFPGPADHQIVGEALRQTQTEGLLDRPLGHISGGERQRVFVARALAQQTPILLLDEPVNSLDLKHQVSILDILRRMQIEQGKTIVTILHDLNLASQYCDRVLLLGGAGRSWIGAAGDVLQKDRICAVFAVEGVQGQAAGWNFFLPVGECSRFRRSNGDLK